MQPKTKLLLQECLADTLPTIQQLSSVYKTPEQVWARKKSIGGGWQGQFVDTPDLDRVYAETDSLISRRSQDFESSLEAEYPKLKQSIGTCFGSMRLEVQWLLRNLLHHIWETNNSFESSPATLSAAVDDFERFLDAPTVDVICRSHLINFYSEITTLDLPRNVRLRRLSDREVSLAHGGTMDRMSFRRRRLSMSDFCIEAKYKIGVHVGEDATQAMTGIIPGREDFDHAILGLRTFKDGVVGYDQLEYEPATFCPLPFGSFWYGDLHVPMGIFNLASSEVEELQVHFSNLSRNVDPAMELACSRLSDSQIRFKAEDRIIDAAIGLEALLLSSIKDEHRHGELRYRFALHFSTLFATPEERHRNFRLARDIYDLRSSVAHGASLKDEQVSIGGLKTTLIEAGKKSTEVLRYVVKRLLTMDPATTYRKQTFWDQAYFGLGTA